MMQFEDRTLYWVHEAIGGTPGCRIKFDIHDSDIVNSTRNQYHSYVEYVDSILIVKRTGLELHAS